MLQIFIKHKSLVRETLQGFCILWILYLCGQKKSKLNYIMRIKYLGFAILLLALLNSCKQDEKYLSITSNTNAISQQGFRLNDTLGLSFTAENFPIDSVIVQINGQRFVKPFLIDSTNISFGVNALKITYYYDNATAYSEYGKVNILASQQEEAMTYSLLETYFHNGNSFTQGLFYKDGMIYESSGLYRKSFLAKYPLGSKTYTDETKHDGKYFAEGIEKFGDHIYQLTWQERMVLKHDFETLDLVAELPLPGSIKEGWGICSDGEQLIISDGTQYLYFVEVTDNQLIIKKSLQIVGYNRIYDRLNELEFVNGYVYANVWQENIIIKINPKNGVVEGVLDLTALTKGKSREQVLNGIAKIDNQTLLVTGKNWKEMYKIRVN